MCLKLLSNSIIKPCGIFISVTGCIYSHSRSFAKPPPQVQTVCECIVVMRGLKEVSWKTAKGMMADTNFLSSLQNFDVDGITQNQVCISLP